MRKFKCVSELVSAKCAIELHFAWNKVFLKDRLERFEINLYLKGLLLPSQMMYTLRRCYTRCGRDDMFITMGVLFSFLKRLFFCWRHKAWCFLEYFACVLLLLHLWSMILSDQWGGKGVTEGVRGCRYPSQWRLVKLYLFDYLNPRESEFCALLPWKK